MNFIFKIKQTVVTAIFLLLFLPGVFGDQSVSNNPSFQRIISLAPSTTEILFALGLGDRIVGVTCYCDYPPAAQKIEKIGGYVDPSYEAIVALKPDLVVLLTSHRDIKVQLEKMKIRTLTVPHKSIGDIHEAIRLIGEATGKSGEAQTLINDLNQRTQTVKKTIEKQPCSRVIVCIGRDMKSSQLSGMCMAGHDAFYNEIIELAGGTNVCNDLSVAYPLLSAEGVVQLNPDVIIDLIGKTDENSTDKIKSQWNQLSTISAVRNKQVFVIMGNHALRPGPRYIEFLEQMARLLHSNAFNKQESDAKQHSDH